MSCGRANDRGLRGMLLGVLLCSGTPLAAQEVSAAPVAPPRFVQLPCAPPAGERQTPLGAVVCGSVTVPQHRRTTGGRNLVPVVLSAAVYASAGAKGTPVLFLAGGPGESSIEAVEQVLLATPTGQVLRRDHPIIAFDRRGIPSAASGASPDLGQFTLTLVGRRAATLNAVAETLSHRVRALRTQGVDAGAFTTASAVQDIVDVLHALHVDKVVLFGVSYGSHEALRFMRLHPEMVEAAVLDGVAPPSATQLLDSAYVASAGRQIVSRIVEECRTDPECGVHYAALARAVAALSDTSGARLRRTARFRLSDNGTVSESWHTLEVAGASVLSVLGVASSLEEIRARVPRIIEEFVNGDTLRDPFAPDVLLAAAIDPSLQTSVRQHISLVRLIAFCGDRPQGEPIARSRFLCDALGVPFDGADAIAPVTSDIPTLLISSGYDAQTPAALADEAARTLRNAHRVHFPTSGHVAFPRQMVSPCAALVIDAFVRRPDSPLPADCASRLMPAFVARASYPAAAEPRP
jgi:pimeloyl-ACP methyl ester carboxylesterase